jgi:hypothetical protein
MIEKSTKEELDIAKWCADWLLDGVACATQDRSFLRGEPEYDDVTSEAILGNGVIAALHAIHKAKALNLAKVEALLEVLSGEDDRGYRLSPEASAALTAMKGGDT